ncbi:hypothetical protein HJC23_004499 [Cyclotella cryptica]|uniref:Uncharacterized protein n=1 Tax=Cyclotella cryptica TaxID=29204 RepID=A0ABD3PS18_9STRA
MGTYTGGNSASSTSSARSDTADAMLGYRNGIIATEDSASGTGALIGDKD